MYCIDGVSTLKNRKPTLILESINKDQNKHANKIGTALREALASKLTEVKGYAGNFGVSVEPAFAA